MMLRQKLQALSFEFIWPETVDLHVFWSSTVGASAEQEAGCHKACIRWHKAEGALLQVAHRLESVMGCHKVIVMEHGRIVEEGSPRELTRVRSKFAELYRAQCRDQASA